MMTREEVRSTLQKIGACGEVDANFKRAYLLPVNHDGRHGFDLSGSRHPVDSVGLCSMCGSDPHEGDCC